MKFFAQIRAMEEGELKSRLLETFMQNSSTSSNTRVSKKPIFVDASYEKNTKSYLWQQQANKVRPLTLGEVSKEIHNMKTEISALKSQVSTLEKEKQEVAYPVSGRNTNYTVHTAPIHEDKVEIAEGRPDPTLGFREMRILAIEYQQHHFKNQCLYQR